MSKIEKYVRKENETNEQLIYRICSDKDKIGSWNDVSDILNTLLGTNYSESCFRKKYQSFKSMLDANRAQFIDSDKQLKEIETKTRELEQERQKLYATKTEYTRAIRQQSRFELFYENVAKEIRETEFTPPSYVVRRLKQDDECYILTIADIHAGAQFITETNEYSYEEITRRFEKLYNQVVWFIDKNNISKLKVLCLGDDIQNILRMNDLKLNESSVVEATVFVARTIASFLNNLSVHCYIDYYHTPSSNHSQMRPLGSKASELASEDIEYIIGHYIKDVLAKNDRIKINLNFGYEYIEIPIFDFKAIAMHGHQINNIGNVLKDISFQKKTFYSTVFLAHYHAGESKTAGEMNDADCEVIVCPSFVGTCPYAERLMKGAKPACCIYSFDRKLGHIDTHKIILK